MSHAVDLGRRLVALRWSLFDAAVALLLVSASAELRDGATTEWWIFAAPMVAGLLIRRRLPVLAVVLAGFGALGHHLDSAAVLEPLDLAVPLTLYTLAGGDRPRRTVAIAFATALVCPFLLGVFYVLGPSNEPPPPSPQATAKVKQLEDLGLAPYPKTDGSVPVKNPGGDATGEQSESDVVSAAAGQAILIALVLGLAFAFGDNARRRRLHLRTLETRAADLEREQRQRIALATAAERARITRELHDVVAHGLSVMVIQAQGGAAALARHPDRTAEALQNVITTGRASLDEMRRLLGLVRHEPSEDPQLAPQPGIGALPDLIERMRAAGARVAFTVHGDPVSLPASLDLTAYRIVQEALTNTIQHAGAGATTAVELDFRPDALTVEVQDDGDGPPAAPAAEGNGLRGIAERVGMLGGELAAGPAESGGFLVRAVLPLRMDEVPG